MKKDNYNDEFKAIFNIKMRKKGFTNITALSEHLGYKPSMIQHFFTGDIDLKERDLNKIFDFLEIDNVYRDLFVEEVKVEPRYKIKRKEVENGEQK